MGRVYKQLVYWAKGGKPQVVRLQVDTGADRTIIARVPPGGIIKGEGCINQTPVDLVDVTAFIPDTVCSALLEVAVPRRSGSLPSVIDADFFQATKAVLDYDGEVVGCPRRRSRASAKGFAGVERTGILKFRRGRCRKVRR